MVSLWFLYAFLKLLTVFALFMSPGTMFHASTTLFEKKFLLVSSLAACGLRFNGSAALLVVLIETSTVWNQVVLSTLSNPRMILNAWSMSAWWRCYSSVVRPISFNFSSYVAPLRPDIIDTARCWIFSRQDLSASSQGDQDVTANSRWGLTYWT